MIRVSECLTEKKITEPDAASINRRPESSAATLAGVNSIVTSRQININLFMLLFTNFRRLVSLINNFSSINPAVQREPSSEREGISHHGN